MAWQDKMIPMVRIMISDLSGTPTYSDMRLEQVIVVSAHYVKQEIEFDTTYTVTIETPDISPDPTVTATQDDVFVNFIVLKAACMVDFSTYRTEALRSGVEAKCGPAVLKTLDRLPGFTTLLNKGPCEAYVELKKEYQFGNISICKAILSPFIGNNFDPRSLAAHYPSVRGGGYGYSGGDMYG